mmetsp:Transcript_47424/g.122688  ORF Transcript_47424/g.122688 Transcript_47424/m.122688 type:complete len:205 (+) Transcript_47424:1359-1973(+)
MEVDFDLSVDILPCLFFNFFSLYSPPLSPTLATPIPSLSFFCSSSHERENKIKGCSLYVIHFALKNQSSGVFDVLLEHLQPLCTDSTINNTMVAAECYCHYIGHLHGRADVENRVDLLVCESGLSEGILLVFHCHSAFSSWQHLLHGSAHTQDAGLRGVDDGSELRYAKHAQVGNGKGTALELFRAQASSLSTSCKFFDFIGDV